MAVISPRFCNLVRVFAPLVTGERLSVEDGTGRGGGGRVVQRTKEKPLASNLSDRKLLAIRVNGFICTLILASYSLPI